jgi:xanthine/uracil permease
LYALTGTAALLLGVVERRRGRSDPRLWPTFWFATGALLLVMAVGRASNVSDLLTELGRERARSGGWYEVRRSLQAWVIGTVAAVWAVTVAIAVWRVPDRRRRYLPTVIVVFTLVCFIGIRLISLHQVDALLHNRDVGGVTIGAVIEVGLLILVVAVTAWRFRGPNRARTRGHTEPPAGHSVESGAGRPLST